MALGEAEKKIVLAALRLAAPPESLPTHAKALITRASRIIAAEAACEQKRRSRRPCGHVSPDQLEIDLQFKRRPPSISRRTRKRWAKYPFEMVEEARRLRWVKRWIYRDIAEALNLRFGTSVTWITVRDWTVNAYRVMA